MSGVFLSFIFILFSPADGLSFVSMLYSCLKPYQWSHFSRQIQACHGQSFGFHFQEWIFQSQFPDFFFLRLHFSYFNPLNSHSIPFFSNLLSKDKNKVMLQCSLQDWHQFNRNPSPFVLYRTWYRLHIQILPSVLPSLASYVCTKLKLWPLLPKSASWQRTSSWGSSQGHANGQYVWWLVNAFSLKWRDLFLACLAA